MKLLQAFAVAALLAPMIISIPTTTASAACDQAILTFQEAFIAADMQWSMSNAELLAAAVDACGNVPPADPGALLAETQATASATLIAANAAVQSRLPARECGATSVPPLDVSSAKITVVTQRMIPVAPEAKIEELWGPATATYDPNSDLTSYTARGTTGENGEPPKWGLDAWNAGSATASLPNAPQGYGTVYLYGVPIPAVYPATGYGTAKAGCTEDTLGTVCWASGEAKIWLANVYSIYVYGEFSTC